ncbi:MAG TPA: hypothetical protein VMB85_04820 [Bryobacteraceae bacterium]|nr:hypothetical protein [Bryobacteraceae bacterium]
MRFSVAVLLASSAFASELTSPPADLYGGWLNMYDLNFTQAHHVFDQWKQAHPEDSLGPASDAAAYLFAELARLGALESELFIDNSVFETRSRLHPDPHVREMFNREIKSADRLADSTLHSASSSPGALFAKTLTFGLRADFAAMIDKQDLAALRYTKQGRAYADQLMAIEPKAYDAYLGAGIENYLLSLKPAPLRVLLRWTGSQVDREKGIAQLKITAQHGKYLEPFAKLLLAVAALRDDNRSRARQLLGELHRRFPDNPLYLRELKRLAPAAK